MIQSAAFETTMPRPRPAAARPMDRDLARFLAVTARYLLTPEELAALRRKDQRTLNAMGLMPAELDRMLGGIWVAAEK